MTGNLLFDFFIGLAIAGAGAAVTYKIWNFIYDRQYPEQKDRGL